MKRGKKQLYENKALAASITVVFMALVRPDPMPALWETALVVLMMYEGLLYCIRYIRRKQQQEKKQRNRFYRRRDGRRWADTWLRWPLREVS